MKFTARPHDLVWLRSASALMGIKESWVDRQWHAGLPVVVRRDVNESGDIPVGVRGTQRGQRAAGWIKAEDICRIVTPEALVDHERLQHSLFVSQRPVQAAIALTACPWPWHWGITGSTGYQLATGIPVLHDDSDLDLMIRAPQPVNNLKLQQWQSVVNTLPCRTDTQVETPSGAFALNEWLRDGRVLLKTATGPRLTPSPWNNESL